MKKAKDPLAPAKAERSKTADICLNLLSRLNQSGITSDQADIVNLLCYWMYGLGCLDEEIQQIHIHDEMMENEDENQAG